MNEITRFDLDMDGSMEPSEHGQWVRYKEAQREWVGLTDEQLTDCVPEGAQIIEREDDRNRVSLTRQQLHEFVAYVAKLREKNGYGI
jgi:hypothetical protein